MVGVGAPCGVGVSRWRIPRLCLLKLPLRVASRVSVFGVGASSSLTATCSGVCFLSRFGNTLCSVSANSARGSF